MARCKALNELLDNKPYILHSIRSLRVCLPVDQFDSQGTRMAQLLLRTTHAQTLSTQQQIEAIIISWTLDSELSGRRSFAGASWKTCWIQSLHYHALNATVMDLKADMDAAVC